MKLFARYNRVNLIATVVVLSVTGVIYYWAISYILNHQVDKDIRTEEVESMAFIKNHNALPPAIDYKDQQVSYAPVDHMIKRHFENIDFYNKKEKEYEAGRALISTVTANGRIYKMTISESKVETEDLIRIVFGITIGVILFLLLTLLLINRFVLNRMWKPFDDILQQLKTLKLNDAGEMKSTASKIDEFDELNAAVTQMSARVKTDYKDLKAFTENAAHELLTPIAVINSKLDSLIQTGDYNEPQSKLLDDVYGAVSRLTRLNQSLLLLVKIENKLVKDDEQVNLKPLIEEKLSEFKELFEDKKLRFTSILVDRQINISLYLIEILLNNLLSNAMRHNYTGGDIRVILTRDKLVVQNTGEAGALSGADIFRRFSKSATSEGTGLGLTICRQICENYDYIITYIYDTPYHTFTITFN